MKKTVLLYNINKSKIGPISFILSSHRITETIVEKNMFSCSIGYLINPSEYPSVSFRTGDDFSDEMMVFCNLEDNELDSILGSMRQLKVSVPLKAVLTDSNILWSSSKLHSELMEESRIMKEKYGK